MSPANDHQALITRYLLGELSESDQQAFEEAYFRDAALFEQVAIVETELIDDFVRGRLDESIRARFETQYLAEGRRRERVKFAEALAATSDQSSEAHGIGASAIEAPRRQTSTAFKPAWAVAAMLIIAAGGWMFYVTRGSQSEPAIGVTAPAAEPRPSIVTFAITLNPATRSQDTRPEVLSLGEGAAEVQLQITVREPEYDRYRIILRRLGGDELRRDEFDAREPSDAAVTLRIEAARFEPGDYLLTLQGRRPSGDFEDARQSILRVTRP